MAKLTDKNRLSIVNPKLASEWSSSNILTPRDVAFSSNKEAEWICTVCGRNYKARISNRSNGSNCPYCSGRKACLENCLATKRPDLAKEWSDNNKLTPYEVTCGSVKKPEWKCLKCCYKWKAAICDRFKGRGCPYCANKKVCLNNCLATTHPELAKQWHPKNKLTPFDITFGSGKNFDWLCQECNHVWKATVNDRSNGYDCPCCNESKGEKRVAFILNDLTLKFKRQYKFKDCKNKKELPFDFGILNEKEELLCLIEYQGKQHYKMVNFGGHCGIEGHRKIIINDKIKYLYCKKNKIPLLRIPYWCFDKIEILINKYLKDVIK